MAQAIIAAVLSRKTNVLTEKEPLRGETVGSLKCCVEPSYTENAGSVEKNQKLQCMSTKIK